MKHNTSNSNPKGVVIDHVKGSSNGNDDVLLNNLTSEKEVQEHNNMSMTNNNVIFEQRWKI